jgi:ABC-type nitrate/sulfonate/bicarbonate transport system permease component
MMATLAAYRSLILGTLSMLSIVVIWQMVVDLGLISPFFVSTPTAVWNEFVKQWGNGIIIRHTLSTLHSFGLAIGLASVVGIGLGLVAGWYRDFESAIDPFIWFKYSAPTIAFYPLFIAWLGYGTPTIVAIAFLFAITPIYANTVAALKGLDRDLVRVTRCFGGTPLDIFLRVAIPASVPMIVAGLRLGVGRALTGVIVAELFGASSGLGFAVAFYGQRLQTTPMMVSIIVVIVLGVILTQLLSYLENSVNGWRIDRASR